MRIEGALSKWNDDRGFGFITPAQGGREIFVHISAFPGNGQRPVVGEKLSFEIETDASGKQRAKRLICPDRKTEPMRTNRASSHRHRGKRGFLGPLIMFGIAAWLAVYAYGSYSRHLEQRKALAAQANDDYAQSAFHCDGRTSCSQMTSCAEATYFLRNCPGAKMDGNNDGVPCEQQWCH